MPTNSIKAFHLFNTESKSELEIQEVNSDKKLCILYNSDDPMTCDIFELDLNQVETLYEFLKQQVNIL